MVDLCTIIIIDIYIYTCTNIVINGRHLIITFKYDCCSFLFLNRHLNGKNQTDTQVVYTTI